MAVVLPHAQFPRKGLDSALDNLVLFLVSTCYSDSILKPKHSHYSPRSRIIIRPLYLLFKRFFVL